MGAAQGQQFCRVSGDAMTLSYAAIDQIKLSARTYNRMKELGVTQEQLARWQAEPDEEFVGAGLGTLRDIPAYAALRAFQGSVVLEPKQADPPNKEEAAVRQTHPGG